MRSIIYSVYLAIFLLSCSVENELDMYGNEKAHIEVKMMPDNSSLQTRATEPGNDLLNENKIENLHVFFFPNNASDSQQCLHYEYFTGLSFLGTGVFSKELTVSKTLFSTGVTYDIYSIANLPANVTIPATVTLGTIKSLRTLSPITSQGSQSRFIMDGKVSAIVNPVASVPIVYIDMPLKRAVSKIRVKFVLSPSAGVSGATVAQVSLRSFAKNSALIDNAPLTLTASDYDNSPYVTATPLTTFTFYCYENNWGTSTATETYLMVNLPYQARLSNYYRIPINKYANSTSTGRIERNMIYDVTAYIDSNGTDTESGAVTVNGNCIITDWTSKEVILKTISQHYLGISEYSIVMPNISTFTLKYVSDLPVSITNITAYCTQYSSTGASSNVTYSSGQSQFPVFTINSASSTVSINSAIPVNYVPKYMSFTVTNNQGLSLNATIIQYPARYVTVRASSGNIKPEWLTGGTNLNLFTVNTLVPSANGSYTLGDPTNGFAKTDSTAIGNKMVSPRFIIASQYGVYTRVSYDVAQNRCFFYGEDIYRSGWRIPTKAEIELINSIQDDANSAVKALLTGDAYWSAFKYDYYNFTNNSWINAGATGTAFIRCVYDLYKDEQ